jgi:hypothetical protein
MVARLVFAKSQDDATALIVAVAGGRRWKALDCLRMLVEHGADIEACFEVTCCFAHVFLSIERFFSSVLDFLCDLQRVCIVFRVVWH